VQGDEITTGQVKQFDLPCSAFTSHIDKDCHYVPIYRSTTDVTATSSSASETAPNAYEFCRIKWMAGRKTLTMNLAMKARAHLDGHMMRLEVVHNGQVLGENIVVVETLYGA
jgi:hypothetical protein